MKPQLALHIPRVRESLWSPVGRYDSIAAELADGHYSRQSIGDDQYMPPGKCVAYVHHGPIGYAVWSAVYNVFREVWRWRNTIFANRSGTLSSLLIETATAATYEDWARLYGALPEMPLTSEIDIAATAARRSKHAPPRSLLCGSGLDLGAIDAPRLRSRRPQGHLRSAAGRRVR